MGRAKRVIHLQHGQDRFNERIPIGAKSSIDRAKTQQGPGRCLKRIGA
jgi:hypothetical protein